MRPQQRTCVLRDVENLIKSTHSRIWCGEELIRKPAGRRLAVDFTQRPSKTLLLLLTLIFLILYYAASLAYSAQAADRKENKVCNNNDNAKGLRHHPQKSLGAQNIYENKTKKVTRANVFPTGGSFTRCARERPSPQHTQHKTHSAGAAFLKITKCHATAQGLAQFLNYFGIIWSYQSEGCYI